MIYFQIYKWAILCGLISAAALAQLGCHLASRDKALMSLSTSQAATVGALLGAFLFDFWRDDYYVYYKFAGMITGFFCSLFIFIYTSRLVKSKRASKNTVFIVVFVVLLSASYWLISFLPNLESHMAQSFFGDLVTLSGIELWVSFSISLISLIVLIYKRKVFSNDSFIIPIKGEEHIEGEKSLILFKALSLILITFSIFSLGLLFTISCLFIPTIVLSYSKKISLFFHLNSSSLIAALGCLVGFTLSLYFDRFATVPTIVFAVLILSVLYIKITNFFFGKK